MGTLMDTRHACFYSQPLSEELTVEMPLFFVELAWLEAVCALIELGEGPCGRWRLLEMVSGAR